MSNKVNSLLGFAMKAGGIVSGEDSCKAEIKRNRVYLIIIAEDASNNTKKTFLDKASYRSIPIRFYGTKETLGKAIGKLTRATIAVKEEGFAKKLLELMDDDGKGI